MSNNEEKKIPAQKDAAFAVTMEIPAQKDAAFAVTMDDGNK
jgi:hypothetical protein